MLQYRAQSNSSLKLNLLRLPPQDALFYSELEIPTFTRNTPKLFRRLSQPKMDNTSIKTSSPGKRASPLVKMPQIYRRSLSQHSIESPQKQATTPQPKVKSFLQRKAQLRIVNRIFSSVSQH